MFTQSLFVADYSRYNGSLFNTLTTHSRYLPGNPSTILHHTTFLLIRYGKSLKHSKHLHLSFAFDYTIRMQATSNLKIYDTPEKSCSEYSVLVLDMSAQEILSIFDKKVY